MQVGLTISIGLHAAVIAALWFGPPSFGEPMAPNQPMSVEVVSTDVLKQKSTPTEPDKAPAPEPEPEPKAEPAPQPETETAPEPSPEPKTTSQSQPDPEPAPEPPEPGTSPAPPSPETSDAPERAPQPDSAPVPKPRSKPDLQLAQADKPEPEPEPDAEPAATPEPATKQAKPETDRDPPKPKAKPTPRVQLEDEKQKQKDESEDQLTSILKDVENELSQAAKENDTSQADQEPAEPEADQQAKAESEPERTPTANQQLSASQIGNVRRQLQKCWSVPAGAKDAANLVVEIAVTLNRDGSVRRARIATTERMNDSFYRAAAESALRAVNKCSPLEGLPVDKYETWREMRLTFDPEEMFDS